MALFSDLKSTMNDSGYSNYIDSHTTVLEPSVWESMCIPDSLVLTVKNVAFFFNYKVTPLKKNK